MTPIHEVFMRRCLDLARNGLGSVAPNPMVGAVVVLDGRIIGEGFHAASGKPHAEVEAISRVKDHSLLKDATLYVNLEPCNHHGKTPPCTDMILDKGIRKVVIGQTDPNPAAGGGIDRLRNQGVEVITGVLGQESLFLNRRFNTFHDRKRPYLILKWAQTADGFVDATREGADRQKPFWVTDSVCRRLVHKWRSEEQAILAGSQTVMLDDPQLDVREWSGNHPLRITIDRTGRLTDMLPEPGFHLLDGSHSTLIYTCLDQKNRPNLEFVRISPDEPVWTQVIEDLHGRNIQSVMIEGGPILFDTLIRENLWDEARIFIGPGWLGRGVRAPLFPFRASGEEAIGNSRLMWFGREDMRT